MMQTWLITGKNADGEPARLASSGPVRTKEQVVEEVKGSHPGFDVTTAEVVDATELLNETNRVEPVVRRRMEKNEAAE